MPAVTFNTEFDPRHGLGMHMSPNPQFGDIRGEIRRAEPMSRHTSWRTGGPADHFFIPADLQDLGVYLSAIGDADDITWVGLGSNLLVRDAGIAGHVISVTGVLDDITDAGEYCLSAGAGVTCAKLARYAAGRGYTGLEFFAGIPGSVGGALAMNAGAFDGETWDLVTTVTTINRQGKSRKYRRDEIRTAYRSVAIPKGEWFIEATFKLRPDHDGSAQGRIKALLARRSASQPTGEHSCGSVFRNPEGDYAGRLIEACGLKGARVGAASVSGKHANFIINEGGATAADIETLIGRIQDSVQAMTGIRLEPEVRIVGRSHAGGKR